MDFLIYRFFKIKRDCLCLSTRRFSFEVNLNESLIKTYAFLVTFKKK